MQEELRQFAQGLTSDELCCTAKLRPAARRLRQALHCPDSATRKLVDAILSTDEIEILELLKSGRHCINNVCEYLLPSTSGECHRSVTPLAIATHFCTRRLVKKLLKKGGDPNIRCDFTPLGIAVHGNRVKLVSVLLEFGADINMHSYPNLLEISSGKCSLIKQSVLHIASHCGFTTMAVYLLVKGASANVWNCNNETPIDSAAKRRHYVTQNSLEYCCRLSSISTPQITTISDLSSDIVSHLSAACMNGDLAVVKLLMSTVFFSVIPGQYFSPLHFACFRGSVQLAKILVGRHPSVCAAKNEFNSPVEVALECGHLDVVLLLIESGMPVSGKVLLAQNSHGNTLLHIACTGERPAAVACLLQQGALLAVVNKDGKSAMHFALLGKNNEIKALVVKHVFNVVHEPRRQVAEFFGKNTVFERCQHIAECRLMCSILRSSLFQYQMLQDRHLGCEVENLCNRCGKLTFSACYFLLSNNMFASFDEALRSCCSSHSVPHKSTLLFLYHVRDQISLPHDVFQKLFSCLAENGADINAGDCSNNSILHIACARGDENTIDLLFRLGANANCRNVDGHTPLWTAFDNNYCHIVANMITEKLVQVDDQVLHGYNREGNTLLLMLLENQVSYNLFELVERGARINPPLSTSLSGIYRYRPMCKRLLDVLFRDSKADLVFSLIQGGCTDFSEQCLFRIDDLIPCRLRNNTSLINYKVKLWKWLRQAGVGFKSIERAVRVKLNEMEENHTPSIFIRVQTTSSTDTGIPDSTSLQHDMEWLRQDIENPPTLYRQCVNRIRWQLIICEAHGKSIYTAVDQLPLPTRLKNSLKLVDIDDDAVDMIQSWRSSVAGSTLETNSTSRYNLFVAAMMNRPNPVRNIFPREQTQYCRFRSDNYLDFDESASLIRSLSDYVQTWPTYDHRYAIRCGGSTLWSQSRTSMCQFLR